MATLFGTAAQSTSIQRVGEGVSRATDVSRSGVLFTQDWVQRELFAGNVYGVMVGSATTPVTFNATYGAAEQDLYIYVPANVAIIPIYLSVGFEDTGTAQVMDVFASISATGDSAVTGTALTKYNLRTDAPYTSSVTATGVVTAAGSTEAAGNYIEFWRPYAGFGEDAFNGSTGWVNSNIHGVDWSISKAGFAPLVMPTGCLVMFASGQAATGFIRAIWVELPSSVFAI